MGLLDRMFGRKPQQYPSQTSYGQPSYDQSGYGQAGYGQPGQGGTSEDERAVARYTYLLRTAPPEELERIHAEAFEKLTHQQRQQVLQRLAQDLPAAEKPTTDDPRQMARAATRIEMRNPGYMRSAFGGGGGMGMGGTIAGSMMGTIAGVVIGSAIADAMFDGYEGSPEAMEAGDTGGDLSGDGGLTEDGGGNFNDDAQLETGSVDDGGGGGFFDGGGGDFGGGDFGGGFGDF